MNTRETFKECYNNIHAGATITYMQGADTQNHKSIKPQMNTRVIILKLLFSVAMNGLKLLCTTIVLIIHGIFEKTINEWSMAYLRIPQLPQTRRPLQLQINNASIFENTTTPTGPKRPLEIKQTSKTKEDQQTPLETKGNHWRPAETPWDQGRSLETRQKQCRPSRDPWRPRKTSRHPWRTSETIRETLEIKGDPWRPGRKNGDQAETHWDQRRPADTLETKRDHQRDPWRPGETTGPQQRPTGD